MDSEYVAGKDYTAIGSNFTAKGEVLSELRGLQADLNNFAPVANFEGVKIDGIVGPRTLDAHRRQHRGGREVRAAHPRVAPDHRGQDARRRDVPRAQER